MAAGQGWQRKPQRKYLLCQSQNEMRWFSPASVPIPTPSFLYPCPGEREKFPSYLPAVTTPSGGKPFSALPLSSKLQVAEAGQGHLSSVGLSSCTKLGVCPKWGKEGLNPAGSRAKHQGGRGALLVPAASGLCASAGSAVMATIKYDGSWSRTTVLSVSHYKGFGPWLFVSLGTPRGAGASQYWSKSPGCSPGRPEIIRWSGRTGGSCSCSPHLLGCAGQGAQRRPSS